ncbi:Elongator subunit elp2 [Binucleata daphniae]
MLQNHLLSAGCSKRCNTSVVYKDNLIYASGTNILIANSTHVENIILRQNLGEVIYVNVRDDFLFVSDSLGNLECYRLTNNDGLVHKLFYTKNYTSAIYSVTGNENLIIAAQLKKLIICENENTNYFDFENIISCVEMCASYILIAFYTGEVGIYTYEDNSLNKIYKTTCHNDNITSIKVQNFENNSYFCSTSTDNTAKIYKININNTKQSNIDNIKIAENGTKGSENSTADGAHETNLTHNDSQICVFELITTLFGHKDYVNGCTWTNNNDLITCSADNTIIFWKHENSTWHLSQRLGGTKEKNQMFYNVNYMQNCILAQSNTGGMYKYVNFMLEKYLTGSTASITSIDCYQDLVLTTSLDSTTRIYSILLKQEIGRPQIHGYPMQSACFLRNNTYEFISGGQETIMRVFKPTKLFLQNYLQLINEHEKNATKISIQCKEIKSNIMKNMDKDMVSYARLSELSLSNDVCYDNFETLLKEGNNERNLAASFLFQEVKKIYGHFFDTASIATSKNLIISCNKSSQKKYAPIFVWNTNFEKLDAIEMHNLGIQQLKFSHDEKYVVACSRDLHVSLYEIKDKKLINLYFAKQHNRCVNDCDISYDNQYIGSVSKDQTVKIYSMKENKIIYIYNHNCETTAIKFSTKAQKIFVGTKNGELLIFDYIGDVFVCTKTVVVNSLSINSILFSQCETYLITGGADNLLQIHSITL